MYMHTLKFLGTNMYLCALVFSLFAGHLLIVKLHITQEQSMSARLSVCAVTVHVKLYAQT